MCGYINCSAWGVTHYFTAADGNKQWATGGQGGYTIRAALGVPNASEQGIQSGMSHKWPWSAT